MSNLTSSIVRGFGFTIGRKAANTLVNQISVSDVDTSPKYQETIPEQVKLSSVQKVVSLILHLTIVFLLAFVAKSTGGGTFFALFNFGYFLIGWIIPVNIFAKINESKYLPIIKEQENKIRERLYIEIDSLITKISEGPFPGWAAPLNPNDRYDGDWSEMKYKYPTNHLQVIKDTFNRMINFTDKYVEEFGFDKFKEITGEDEPTVGMTEKEFNLWKTNNDSLITPFKDILRYPSTPTKIEESVSNDTVYRTLIYGTKTTGSYYKFKNGVLQSYTQRD